MKSKPKLIILTFIATTAFWALVVVGLFWWLQSQVPDTDLSFIAEANKLGYFQMMAVQNNEKQAVTFVIEELRTNAAGLITSNNPWLERQMAPSEDFVIGIRKTNLQSK